MTSHITLMASLGNSLAPHDSPRTGKIQAPLHSPNRSTVWQTSGINVKESNTDVTYSHDRLLAQADTYREEKKNLQDALQSIQEKFSSSIVNSHSGHSNCQCCKAKNQKILEAYKNYFLSSNPTSWYADFPEYKSAIQARLQNIKTLTKQDLRDLLLISRKMLREYIITVTRGLKLDVDVKLFDGTTEYDTIDNSLAHLIEKVNDVILPNFPNPDAKQLVLSLQETKNAAERAPLYIKYYCALSPNDTHQLKNFKAKYARMFESRCTHDEVLAAMRKEAQDLNFDKVNSLHKELSELQLAQSAHLKNKARKAEKDLRMRDRDPTLKSTYCSLGSCGIELDMNEENIECATCEWLDSKGGDKGRFFYCTAEHAEEDFNKHDRHQHQCFAGDRCFYYPQAGPPGETDAGGICLSCKQSKEGVFYFCSTNCYHHNIDLHANRYHIFDYQRDDMNVLEQYQHTESMKIIL